MQSCNSVISSYLHKVQYSRPWNRHLCAMDVALGGVAELDSSRIWLGDAKIADCRTMSFIPSLKLSSPHHT